MSDVNDQRITVSREALRAELAEMELRMRIWMSAELEEKASASDLAALRAELATMAPLRDHAFNQLERINSWRDEANAGHFTEAQDAAMRRTAAQVLEERASEGWSQRERGFAIVAVLTTVIVSAINVLQATGVIG
jgi:hypothetical protein